jgi:hypothetical protein
VRVGIIVAYTDYHRKGRPHRGVLQPQIGPLIAALLPNGIEVEVVNDTFTDPDWTRDYDLLFISSMHSDFDRAKQISHYWRRRGATTVYGGILASTYTRLCAPYFDAVVVGDPEDTVPRLFEDFRRGELQPVYVSSGYDPLRTPVPRFDLLANKQVVPLSMEITRGCPFTCEFCALTGWGARHHTRRAAHAARTGAFLPASHGGLLRQQHRRQPGLPAQPLRSAGAAGADVGIGHHVQCGGGRRSGAHALPLRLPLPVHGPGASTENPSWTCTSCRTPWKRRNSS